MNVTKPNKIIKSNFTKIKVDSSFTISYNVRGLSPNLPEVAYHLMDVKPDLFLSETGLDNSISLQSWATHP